MFGIAPVTGVLLACLVSKLISTLTRYTATANDLAELAVPLRLRSMLPLVLFRKCFKASCVGLPSAAPVYIKRLDIGIYTIY